MKITDLFIKRPVLAICVNLVILIAGLQAIRSLSVRQYPRSDIAVVQVSTVYVGANADLVRGFITTPLERVIASADGIDYMESSSAQGVSTITVHLKLNYDTNAALTQIQAKVAQVRNDLPPEAEAPVIELETADNQFAAMYLGFSSSKKMAWSFASVTSPTSCWAPRTTSRTYASMGRRRRSWECGCFLPPTRWR